MRLIKHQNADSGMIAVTDTATLLFALIDTAGGVSNSQSYYMGLMASGLLITPEEGDVRMMVGNTPTDVLGTLLSSGVKYYFPLIDLTEVQLITTGLLSAKCSIDLFIADLSDTFEGVPEVITLEGGSVAVTSLPQDTSLSASSPTVAVVGVVSAEAVAAKSTRKGLVLTNLSANDISLGIGAAAVLGSGITLKPNGVWVMDKYTFTNGQIRAIAGGAGSNLSVQEFY